MKNILVYRVQNAEGYGPYSGVTDAIDSCMWSVLDNHRLPKDDGLEIIYEDEVCAFENIESVREWFTESMVNILSVDDMTDWFLALYEVPENSVRYGDHQVLAIADDMIFVDSVKIDELYS